ncbi:MAG: hypothetical protein ABID63_08850 [Pseudomonadota bacterium]
MTAELRQLVEDTIARGVGARVFPLRWQGQRVWVKQAVPNKVKGWHRLQRLIATLTGLPMLRPTVSPGGAAGLQSEGRVLRGLALAGVPVPDVVLQTDVWLVIGDNGAILQNVIEDAVRDGDEALVTGMIERAALALAGLHARAAAHGAPLLRNITLRDAGDIGFIDFEEDPNARMPLPDAQARDVLLFLFSIQRGFKRRADLVRAGWQAYLTAAGRDAPQLRPIGKVVQFLGPVYWLLRPFRRWLGTDALNGMLAYRILHHGIRRQS